MPLTAGQRVTLLRIDNCLAMTHRFELQVERVLEPITVGHDNRRRVAIVRRRGKRTNIYLDMADDDILLDGWNIPFRIDGDCDGVVHGNACFNLVGDPAVIRECIEKKSVFPVTDDAKAKIIVSSVPQTTSSDDGSELLYPNIVTHHAVINRMKGIDD